MSRLLDQAEIMFRALQDLGPGWHTRKEIAERLGVKVFGGYQTAVLDVLTGSGRVIAEQKPIRGPIGHRWEYRINEGKST